MDDRLRICLWMVGGGLFCSLLGGGFGALTGALYARSGRAAGTRMARRLVENLLESGEHRPSPIGRAALIGAADGFGFLGILGFIAGALLGVSGRSTDELLIPLLVGSVLLVGGAAFFGALAYALTYHATECVYAGGIGLLGCFLSSTLLGFRFGPVGLILGIFLGLNLCRTVRRYSPKFQPPRFEKAKTPPHADSSADITDIRPENATEDFFRSQDEV